MKIKILKCSDASLWYNRHIMKEFEIYRKEIDLYDFKNPRIYLWVRTGDEWNTLNWIYEHDVEYLKG